MQIRLLPTTLLFALVSTATAGPVLVDYTLNLGSGTLYGNDLSNVMIMETGSGLTSLDFPYTVPHSGVSVLSHTAAFQPTSSLIVGLDNATHLVFFTNSAFAFGANGILFSVAFPHTHHNDFVNRLLLAEGGDATQAAWITDFFLTGDGSHAAFATGTQPIAIEFSVGTIPSPEPLTFGIVGLGLVAMLAARRIRRT